MCDETIADYLQRTCDPDPLKRKLALKDLCPCHVRADIPELWDRIFELLSDKEGMVNSVVRPHGETTALPIEFGPRELSA
jgi:hypothetical protein